MNSAFSKRISLERPSLLPYGVRCLKVAVSCGSQASRILRSPRNPDKAQTVVLATRRRWLNWGFPVP